MLKLVALPLLLLPALACADRITEMSPAELCAYKAKLSVAAYYYFRQGKPRAEVTIHWHGDETENEIDFVSRVLDETYSTAEADQRDRPEQRFSEQAFGDRTYNTCIEKLGQTRLPSAPTLRQSGRWTISSTGAS
jgi:hypothetical protein